MTSLVRGIRWGGLLVVLLAAPVPLGSVNTQWSMLLAVACLVLGSIGVVVLPLLERRRVALPGLLLPAGLLVVWFGLQLVPLPRSLIGVISPERLTFPVGPEEPAAVSLSLCPAQTLELGLLHLGLFYLLWSLVITPSRAPLRILALAGGLHAMFGLYLWATGGTGAGREISRVMWIYRKDEVLTPFGTYWNKNHFAGLMIIAGGACLAVFLRRLSHALRGTAGLGWPSRLGALTSRGSFRFFLPSIGLVAVALAIAESGSLGAVVASIAAIGALLVIFAALSLSRGARAAVLVVSLAAFMGASLLVAGRLTGDKKINRPGLWKNTLQMAAKYPVTGTGLGSFKYAFPRYQQVNPDRRFSHAEGDWIQYLAETGAVGVLALLTFGVAIWRIVLRALRRGGTLRAVASGGFVGLAGIVFHGFVDTSLHIPANMLAATVLLGGTVGSIGRGTDSLIEGATR